MSSIFTSCSQFTAVGIFQCAIPVFDGLLPEPHNARILKLLFTTAHWHGLAKLRSHNDLTLDILDSVTESLGKELRYFRDHTSSAFATRELEREYRARVQREARSGGDKRSGNARSTSVTASTNATASDVISNSMQPNTDPTSAQDFSPAPENAITHSPNGIGVAHPLPSTAVPTPVQPLTTASSTQPTITDVTAAGPISVPFRSLVGRHPKTFSLNTYKIHSIGDYAATIRKYGTTDSYTTEIVSKPNYCPSQKLS